MRKIVLFSVLMAYLPLLVSCHYYGHPFRRHQSEDLIAAEESAQKKFEKTFVEYAFEAAVFDAITSNINSNPFIGKIEGNKVWIWKSDWMRMSANEKYKIISVLSHFIYDSMIEIVDPITGKTYEYINNTVIV